MRYSVARMKGPLKALLARDYPMVKWVKDATEPLHFRTNTMDVRKAQPSSFTNCTASRCIKRTLPGRAAIVSRSVAFIIDGVTAVRYCISAGGATRRKIIDNADLRSQGIVGQSFTLGAPKAGKALGSRHPRTATNPSKKHEQYMLRKTNLPLEEAPGTIVSFATGMRAV